MVIEQDISNLSRTSRYARHAAAYVIVAAAYTLTAVVISCFAPRMAYAYVDPSVMTYAIQAVAGVAVALSAVVGVALRRTRKWLFNLFGIDPEAKRESDPPYSIFEREQPEAISMTAEALQQAGEATDTSPNYKYCDNAESHSEENGEEQYKPKWLRRLAVAFIVFFMTSATLLFVAPIEIVAASNSDFLFGARFIAPYFFVYALVVAIALALIASIAQGKAFICISAIALSIGICFWVQAMFLNNGLPVANGVAIQWSDHDFMAIVSAACWAFVLTCSLLAAVKQPRIAQTCFAIIASALIVIQGIGVASLLINDERSSGSSELTTTEKGLFEIAPENNVIVFVLDTYDTYHMIDALEAQPSLRDDLAGFTWYSNPVGALIPTRYGIPFLLTDERPKTDDTWSEFLVERYRRSSFITDVADQGYAVGIYTTHYLPWLPSDMNDEISAACMSVAPVSSTLDFNMTGTLKALTECALYRDLPWILKPRFWFVTSEVSSAMTSTPSSSDPSRTAYVIDDAAYYEKLKANGLTIERNGTVGEFRFIHLDGTHEPYTITAEGTKSESGTTLNEQAIGSMGIVVYYLDQLRALGLYDKATIIITADHGSWNWDEWTSTDLQTPTSPIILAKPPQTQEEAALPLRESDAPVLHDDVIPTVLESVGGDTSSYSGRSLFSYAENEDPNTPRYYLHTVSDTVNDIEIVEYAIEGNVLDINNWHKTGRTWDATE